MHKVLNNNVVIQIDESCRERVLMGRGLGFGLKPSDAVDPAKVEKTFILDDGEAGARELRLLDDTPYPVIQAVARAIDGAERRLGRSLGRGFTIAVLDHVSYVLERLDAGVRIPSTSMPELRHPGVGPHRARRPAVLRGRGGVARHGLRQVSPSGARDAGPPTLTPTHTHTHTHTQRRTHAREETSS
ncbi:CAT RNA binding domain-containing protein [Microbacterium sp. bgisy203]|uniref:CAT RNA binding domain-containing protein n=1 Tax=Microbacterium sp. bgisy203 TaxID=3413799 RepID=UPI003D73B1C8